MVFIVFCHGYDHFVLRWGGAEGDGAAAAAAGRGRVVVLGDTNQQNHRCLAVSPPIYPAGCTSSTVDALVATALQVNLRNSLTVRDAAASLYNEYARDGTIQRMHRDSAEGR